MFSERLKKNDNVSAFDSGSVVTWIATSYNEGVSSLEVVLNCDEQRLQLEADVKHLAGQVPTSIWSHNIHFNISIIFCNGAVI